MDPHARNTGSLPPEGAPTSLEAALREVDMDPHARNTGSLPPEGAPTSLEAALREVA